MTEPKPQEKKAPAYTEEEVIKIMDKKSYPNYNSDKAELEAIRKMYGGSSSYDDDSYGGSSSNHDEEHDEKVKELNFIDPDVNRIENLINTKTKFDKFTNVYAIYWKVYQEQMNSQEPMEKSYNDAKNSIKSFESKINPNNINGNPLFLAQKEMDNAVPYAEKADPAGSSNWNQSEYHMKNASRYIAIIKYQKGTNAAGLSDLVSKNEETKAKIIALKKQFDSKLAAIEYAKIDEKRAPGEKYSGADKESLRQRVIAAWNKQNCKDFKVVKVIFSGSDWKRTRGTDYIKSYSTFTDYDYSELYFTFILKGVADQSIAYICGDFFHLDNLSKKMRDLELSCTPECEKMLSKNLK